MKSRTSRKGSALMVCIIFLVVFIALAVGLAAISTANLQIADNQREANRAFASAESGLDVLRYWVDRVMIPSTIPTSQYLSSAVAALQTDLQDNNISNLVVNNDGSIPPVTLNGTTGQTFAGQISADPADPDALRLHITGRSGNAARTISVGFHIVPYRFPIFDYGMATKGPLVLPRNPRFFADTEGWEADVYVESANSLIAVDIGGNATFAGDIDIGNPHASVSNGGSLTVGGEIQTLQEEDRPEFPVADVEHFRQYATGPVIGPGSDFSTDTLTNAVIAAGTNPQFTASNVNIEGILYIEAPNQVMFMKNVTLQGMIVAQGDVNDPGSNQINIGDPTNPKVPSNFSSGPYPPGAEFDALRNEAGSCILAPGFEVSFWKNFSAINGVIAASGLYFDKNASAGVHGTLIDYSEEPTVVNGNIVMTFDRADMVEIPAGFDLLRELMYDRKSYSVVF